MARSKKKTRKSYRPEGEIRRSQLLMGYGPGAMIDLLNDAVLIAGLDYWKYQRSQHGVEQIDEPRLTAKLIEVMRGLGQNPAINLGLQPPPECNFDDASPVQGIQALEFPRVFKCQRCDTLAYATEFEVSATRGREHNCGAAYGKQLAPAVPVRFVAVCEDGHIDDWPWSSWTHFIGGMPRCEAPSLKLREGASGDISDITIECESCGARAKLAEALIEERRPKCSGARPWLGDFDTVREKCGHQARLLVRTATNGYFAQTMSSLWLPTGDDEVAAVVEAHWADLGDIEDLFELRVMRKRSSQLRAAMPSEWTDEDVFAAIERRRKGIDKALPPLDEAEWEAFETAPMEEPAQQPPLGVRFFAREMVPPSEGLPKGIAKVVVAAKLREVRAQFGFSRLEAALPRPDGGFGEDAKIAPLTLDPKWLPAIEINGEGLFLRFDEDALVEWESREVVRERSDALLVGFRRWAAERRSKVEFRGARYYMLHTLSHLLMTAIALECGYSASSIRERLYCREPKRSEQGGQPGRAGILLSTGTPGSEGTLGGLVEQGRYLRHHFRRAYELGTLCSGDPVCALHDPQLETDDRNTEGAACHSCVYIPETSCEAFNRFLDRALVFPTIGQPEGLAFFGALP